MNPEPRYESDYTQRQVDAVMAEAKRVLAAVDIEELADEVFGQLDMN